MLEKIFMIDQFNTFGYFCERQNLPGRVAQLIARLCPEFDTRSGHILPFPSPLIQEGQL